MSGVLSDFSYNPTNKGIDLFEFRQNALQPSPFHINVFSSVAQDESGNGQPFEIHMIVHDVSINVPDTSYVLFTVDDPLRTWTFHKKDVIVDKYLNDISSIDFEIHHTTPLSSTSGFAPNDFRHIYIQYTPLPEDKTYTSVLADYDFQYLNASNYWSFENSVEFKPYTSTIEEMIPIRSQPDQTALYQIKPTDIQLVVDISFTNAQPIQRFRFDTNGYQPGALFFFGVDTSDSNVTYQLYPPTGNAQRDTTIDLSNADGIIDISFDIPDSFTNGTFSTSYPYDSYRLITSDYGAILTVSGLELFPDKLISSSSVKTISYEEFVSDIVFIDLNYEFENVLAQVELVLNTTNLSGNPQKTPTKLILYAREKLKTSYDEIYSTTNVSILNQYYITINIPSTFATFYNDYRIHLEIERGIADLNVDSVTLNGSVDRHKYQYDWMKPLFRTANYVRMSGQDAKLSQTIPIQTKYNVDGLDSDTIFDGLTTNPIYTYTNAGTYPYEIRAVLGQQPLQDVQTVQNEFQIHKIPQEPFFAVIQDHLGTIYDVSYEMVFDYHKRQITLDSSGGSEDGEVSFTVVNGDPRNASIQDVSFVFEYAGVYEIVATKDGSANYLNISDSIIATIHKSPSVPIAFDIDISYVYDPINKKIPLDICGGNADNDGRVVYSIGNGSGGSITESNQFTYEDVGFYTLIATKDGSANYLDISTSIVLEIVKREQPDFELTNADTYLFDVNTQTIILEVSGGHTESGIIDYSISGPGFPVYTPIVDQNWYYTQVGIYDILATKRGNNYIDKYAHKQIEIVRGPQSFFYILNHEQYIYDPLYQIIPLKAAGGSGTGAVSFSGDNVQYELSSGNYVLNYTDAGRYSIVATKLGNASVFDVSDNMVIDILRAQQSPMTLLTPDIFVYDPSFDPVELRVSGGTGTGDIRFDGSGVLFSNHDNKYYFSYHFS